MAEFGGFFNSVNGDRKYKAEDFAKYFSTFMSTGVNPAIDNLRVYKKNNNTIEIRKGTANINGYLYLLDNPMSLNIEMGTTRVDRIVLKLDLINRTLNIILKKGNSNIPPDLTRDTSVYELSLARIDVGANDINVSDERGIKEVCGFMEFTGEIDIQEMWNIFNNEIASKQKLWNNWFENMQGQSNRGVYIQGEEPSSLVTGDIWIQLLE